MGNIYSPESEAELTILLSLLEREGIEAWVANDYLGPIVSPVNVFSNRPKTIMVRDGQEERAVRVVRDYFKKAAPGKNVVYRPEDAKKADLTMIWILVVFILGFAIKAVLEHFY